MPFPECIPMSLRHDCRCKQYYVWVHDVKNFFFCKCVDSYRKEKVCVASEGYDPTGDVTGDYLLGFLVAFRIKATY